MPINNHANHLQSAPSFKSIAPLTSTHGQAYLIRSPYRTSRVFTPTTNNRQQSREPEIINNGVNAAMLLASCEILIIRLTSQGLEDNAKWFERCPNKAFRCPRVNNWKNQLLLVPLVRITVFLTRVPWPRYKELAFVSSSLIEFRWVSDDIEWPLEPDVRACYQLRAEMVTQLPKLEFGCWWKFAGIRDEIGDSRGCEGTVDKMNPWWFPVANSVAYSIVNAILGENIS